MFVVAFMHSLCVQSYCKYSRKEKKSAAFYEEYLEVSIPKKEILSF